MLEVKDGTNLFKNFKDYSRTPGRPNEFRKAKRGGSYMPLSPAARSSKFRITGWVHCSDEYVHGVTGYTFETEYQLRKWTNYLEDIDFKENTRPHSLALWQLSYNEELRMENKYQYLYSSFWNRVLQDENFIRDRDLFFSKTNELLLRELNAAYSKLKLNKALENATKWIREHKTSSTGSGVRWDFYLDKDGELTQEGISSLTKLLRVLTDLISTLVDNQALFLKDSYAWNPALVFPALRNRPDDLSLSRDYGVLKSENPTYRSRSVGGLYYLSWIGLFLSSDELHNIMSTVINYAAKMRNVIIASPYLDGLESYITYIGAAHSKRAVAFDISNAEKVVGAIGLGIGRINNGYAPSPIGSRLMSGTFTTSLENILFQIFILTQPMNTSLWEFATGKEVLEQFGEIKKFEIFGDNLAIIYNKEVERKEVENTFTKTPIYSQTDYWLGHHVELGRVVGVRVTKDRSEDSISFSPRQRNYYLAEKGVQAEDLLSSMLTRDVPKRYFGNEEYSYENVLLDLNQRIDYSQQREVFRDFFETSNSFDRGFRSGALENVNLIRDLITDLRANLTSLE